MNLLRPEQIEKNFKQKGYLIEDPHGICNESTDTIFITAGIQPLMNKYENALLETNKKIFIAQPVIRTQYINSLEEGSSLAFINVTSSAINISDMHYKSMVKDWYDFLYSVGLKKNNFSTGSDYYIDTWNQIELEGNRTFHYYNGIEIGDTTFFTKVKNNSTEIKFDTLCDLGFGLERIRWLSTKKSYYDIYTDSAALPPKVKALLSAIALIDINGICPSNKNSGYRARLFSKKLVETLNGRNINNKELEYIDECFAYWRDWQKKQFGSKETLLKEYIRNGNRYLINELIALGYKNLSNININITREELYKRLKNSGVENDIVKKLERK